MRLTSSEFGSLLAGSSAPENAVTQCAQLFAAILPSAHVACSRTSGSGSARGFLEHRLVFQPADVAEHHGRVALQAAEFRTLHG